MDLIIVTLFAAFCMYLVSRMLRSTEMIDLQLGLLAIFAMGYYGLPILFRTYTNLDNYFASEVTTSLFMNVSYFVVMATGAFIGTRLFSKPANAAPGVVDLLIYKHITVLGCASAALFLYYVLNTDLTSYAAESRDAFLVGDRGALAGIISTFASLFLAIVATWSALAFSKGKSWTGLLGLGMVLLYSLMAVALGQRLAVLTPLITMVAAMMAFGRRKLTLQLVATAVVVLMLVSPLAVFLRSTQGQSGQTDIWQSIGRFDFGDNAIATSMISLVERADLLENGIFLKNYIDATGYVAWDFYYSVLVSPIPRVIMTDKPYVLSSNGTYTGELSNIAWRLRHQGIGSLTAFGAIMAYHQGGWVIMYLDAVILGLFFAFIAKRFGSGEIFNRIFYIAVFSYISVRKVPPSFLDTLSSLLPLLPIWLAGQLGQFMLSAGRSSRTSRA